MYVIYSDNETLSLKSFSDLDRIEDLARRVLKKYIKKYYRIRNKKFQDDKLVYKSLSKDDPNFQDYTLKIDKEEHQLIDKITTLIEEKTDKLYTAELNRVEELDNVYFDRHLFQPLLGQNGEKIKSSPQGLEDSERRFVDLLSEHLSSGKADDFLEGRELFLLRNLTRSKGVCFLNEADRYYPDFILWIKEDNKQYITFVDPKGIIPLEDLDNDPKVKLAEEIKDKEVQIALNSEIKENIILNSFIMVYSNFQSARGKFRKERQDFNDLNMIFTDDITVTARGINPIDKLLKAIIKQG